MRYRDKILYNLLVALQKRAHFFKDLGCRAADHGLEYISQVEYSEQELDRILEIKLSGSRWLAGGKIQISHYLRSWVDVSQIGLGTAVSFGCFAK